MSRSNGRKRKRKSTGNNEEKQNTLQEISLSTSSKMIEIISESNVESITSTTSAPKKKKRNRNSKKVIEMKTKTIQQNPIQSHDIDDLFDTLKTIKKEKIIENQLKKQSEEEEKKRKNIEKEKLADKIKKLEAQNTNLTAVIGQNPDAKPVRYDEDGLPIYTEASLQINKGGGTADCPFDCWCCF